MNIEPGPWSGHRKYDPFSSWLGLLVLHIGRTSAFHRSLFFLFLEFNQFQTPTPFLFSPYTFRSLYSKSGTYGRIHIRNWIRFVLVVIIHCQRFSWNSQKKQLLTSLVVYIGSAAFDHLFRFQCLLWLVCRYFCRTLLALKV